MFLWGMLHTSTKLGMTRLDTWVAPVVYEVLAEEVGVYELDPQRAVFGVYVEVYAFGQFDGAGYPAFRDLPEVYVEGIYSCVELKSHICSTGYASSLFSLA